MKKLILGLLIGVTVGTTGTAFADDIKSLIGKTIQGQFPVVVDGNKIGDAIVVDGTSYLPVRSFAESIGYAVSFNPEGEIALNKQADPVDEEAKRQYIAERDAAYQEEIARQQAEREKLMRDTERDQKVHLLQKDIDYLRSQLNDMSKGMDEAMRHYIEMGRGTEADFKARPYYQSYLQMQQELADKQKQLAEIQQEK